MTSQGQRLNFKWSVADVMQVERLAKRGYSATRICEELAGSRLESTPDEIIRLCDDMGRFIQTGRPRASL